MSACTVVREDRPPVHDWRVGRSDFHAVLMRRESLAAQAASFAVSGQACNCRKDFHIGLFMHLTCLASCSKKYLIEVLDGNKVVSRKKGITTTACTAAVAASRESPDFQGLPAGEKVRLAGNQQCVRAETKVGAALANSRFWQDISIMSGGHAALNC
jgi:hypothetical protein